MDNNENHTESNNNEENTQKEKDSTENQPQENNDKIKENNEINEKKEIIINDEKKEEIKGEEKKEENETNNDSNENNNENATLNIKEDSEIKNEEKKEEINSEINVEKKDENNNDNNQHQSVTMEIIHDDINIIVDNQNTNINVFPQDFMDDKIRCNELTQKLIAKTKKNTEVKYEEFFTKKRHYLIMTDGGKPVYSRYGDEVENNSIFATISAMITKFTIFNSTDTFKEELNVISNKKNKIVFMKKGQLIFISLSKKPNDTVSLLHSQLEFIYNQLMSILTVKFYEKLEDNPSKVLTAMGGTENLFEQIIQYSSNSFISIFNSYQIMNFQNFGESRDKINRILEDNKGNSLYCILMTPYEIISFVHSNQINVQASDLILIQNLIFCTEMLRTQESYVPICLPGVSDQGFLQLYSHFSEENIGIIFVTENVDPMCFMEFQKKYKEIYDRILEGYSEKILQCMRKNNNMKGENSLFRKNKDEENNKEKITNEILVNNLITKINNMKEKSLIEGKTSSGRLPNVNQNTPNKDLPKTKTLSTNTILKENIVAFKGVKYGVILNRKYNQYIMVNFGMDYRTYSKKEKKLIHKYIMLYDIYNNYKEKEKEKEEFYYVEQSDKYYNVIHVNENFLVIFTFGFFSDVEKIQKKVKEIFKYLKKYESKYFIIYK
jgi:hypothetical protein